jgi:hypothetical protein
MTSVRALFPTLFLIALTFLGCQTDSNSEQDASRKPLARVGEKFLYLDEALDLVPDEMSEKDSADMIARYVDSWVRKQVLFLEAENSAVLSAEELQERLDDYKYQLLIHAYKEHYVSQKLDTTFSEAQILEHYQDNLPNYELKKPILRCLFVKISQDMPAKNIDEIHKAFKQSTDWAELQTQAYAFASLHFLDPDEWLLFSQITAVSPFTEEKLVAMRNGLLREEDERFIYLLKVLEIRKQKESAPLEFVGSQIRSTLLNKRKIELQKNLERQIHQKAVESKKVELFK